jgi:membrane protease YdiL (CAAX protease family)
MIAGGLSQWDTLLLGVSAGVGEELALRGALQPKLGVFLTSLLFALLHVQYSWFGVGIILVLGLLLGTIRNRTSTTVAILVHALYDMFAVFTVQP